MKMEVPPIQPGIKTAQAIQVSSSVALMPTQVKVFVYDAGTIEEYTLDDLLAQRINLAASQTLWVEVVGLQDATSIHKIGEHFLFHPVAVEDVLSTRQRAKVDDYPDYQFVVTKLLENQKAQQISFFLGRNYIVSFFEHECPLNLYLVKNIQNMQNRLRMKGADYLAYEILDFVIDSIFPQLAKNNDRLDVYEDTIVSKPSPKLMRQTQMFKRELRYLRQILWENRDMLTVLMRNDLSLISDGTMIYLRDCYDHVVRQVDILESQRESAIALVDIYLSSLGNRLGQIMKLLTAISIVFMPPTFLAGVWGMNFKNPEYQWAHGYVFAWVMMILSGLLPLLLFWKKGWLGDETK